MKRLMFSLAVLALLAGSAMAGTITGVVTDSTGAAVDNAWVTVRVANPDSSWRGCPGPGGRGGHGPGFGPAMLWATTDADGSFLLENVPEGTQTIRAAKRFLGFDVVQVDVPVDGTVNVELQLPGCLGNGDEDGPGTGNRNRYRHRFMGGIDD